MRVLLLCRAVAAGRPQSPSRRRKSCNRARHGETVAVNENQVCRIVSLDVRISNLCREITGSDRPAGRRVLNGAGEARYGWGCGQFSRPIMINYEQQTCRRGGREAEGDGLLNLPRSYRFNLPNSLQMGACTLKWASSVSFGSVCSPLCSPARGH